MNLADRAARTGFGEEYRLVMKYANPILHGSVGGLASHFDVEADQHRITVPPSDEWIGEALIAAHESTLKAIETLSKTFKLEPIPPLQSLLDDFQFVWNPEKVTPPS